MRGVGAYLVLYGENVALPPLLRTYPVWDGEPSILRDAVVEQVRRALELARSCNVKLPEVNHADRTART